MALKKPNFIREMDWSKLKQQKEVLTGIIQSRKILGSIICDNLDEISKLIDSIQDYAINDLQIDEGVVYDMYPKSIWKEIYNDYVENYICFIDAWKTSNPQEEAITIAKVNTLTLEVEYLCEEAKTDCFAQEKIKEVLDKNKN